MTGMAAEWSVFTINQDLSLLMNEVWVGLIILYQFYNKQWMPVALIGVIHYHMQNTRWLHNRSRLSTTKQLSSPVQLIHTARAAVTMVWWHILKSFFHSNRWARILTKGWEGQIREDNRAVWSQCNDCFDWFHSDYVNKVNVGWAK